MGLPIHLVDDNHTIWSVAIADEATFVEDRMVVALGMVSFIDVQLPDDTRRIRGSLHDVASEMGPAQGNNCVFGWDVKLSRDGSILAVKGAEAIPPADNDHDDDTVNVYASCLICIYQYSEIKGKMGTTWSGHYSQFFKVSLSVGGLTAVSGYHAGYEKDCLEFSVPRGHLRV